MVERESGEGKEKKQMH